MTVDLIADILQQDGIYGLVTHKSSLYAARQSGLYRSLDSGRTWLNCLESLKQGEVLTVTAITAHEDTILAGTKGAILCSSDSGENWMIVGLASPPPEVIAIAISPNFAEDGLAVAGTADDGVFMTTDRGASWVAWNFGLIDAHVFAIVFSPHFTEDRTLFAGTESGIFLSKNGGRGWLETNFPMNAAPVISLAVASHESLYAGTESGGLWVSHDRGITWQQVAADEISGAVNAIMIREHPSQEIAVLLEDKLMRSTDQGHTWSPTSLNVLDGKLPMTMSAHPNDPTTLIVGYSDGALLPVR